MEILMMLAGILSGLMLMIAVLSMARRAVDRIDDRHLQSVLDNLYPFLTAEEMDEKDREWRAMGATLLETTNKDERGAA